MAGSTWSCTEITEHHMRVTVFVAVLVMLGTGSRAAEGQWRIGLELMNSYYKGSAVDTSGNPHARPGNALMPTLQVDTRIKNALVAVRLAYGNPGLSLTGEGLTITDGSHDYLLEGMGTVGFRVGGLGSSGAIRIEVGPSLHLWKVTDETRTRLGGLVGAAYEWPVSERFTGAVRVESIFSKSWFDETDLPSEYRRQATWRYGWGVGLRYRL